MSPTARFYPLHDIAVQSPDDANRLSARTSGHRRQRSVEEDSYSCPYDTEDWISPTPTLVNTSPEVSFGKCVDEEVPSSTKPTSTRSAITITIPLPWSRRSSKRSSSVPTPSDRHHLEEPTNKLHKTPQSTTASKFAAPPLHRRSEVKDDLIIRHVTRQSRDEFSPMSASRSAGGLIPPKLLSPVNELFAEGTNSGPSSIGLSPTTPIDTEIQYSNVQPKPSARELLRQATVQHVEFGVPLASHPVRPSSERSQSRTSEHSQQRSAGLGIGCTSYMRSPSVPLGDVKLKSPHIPLRPRSPSTPATQRPGMEEHRRRRSYSFRRDSGSTTDSSSTVDDESVIGSADERYFQAKSNWHGSAGLGGTGFYKTVLDDYKMISKGVSEDVITRKIPQQAIPETFPTIKIIDVECIPPQELVESGEDLWG